MPYIIKHINSHVEVYNNTGQFLFSADTEQEALEDIRLEYQAA